MLLLLLAAMAWGEDCTVLVRGCGEGSLAVSANISPDRGRTVAPALQAGAAFGLTRHVAATGSYAHTWLASAGTRNVNARVRLHEVVGGVRIGMARSVSPYVQGLAGAEVVRISARAGSISDSGSATRAVFGGGGGVTVAINRHVGVLVDARIMTDRRWVYYGRLSVGFLLRGR